MEWSRFGYSVVLGSVAILAIDIFFAYIIFRKATEKRSTGVASWITMLLMAIATMALFAYTAMRFNLHTLEVVVKLAGVFWLAGSAPLILFDGIHDRRSITATSASLAQAVLRLLAAAAITSHFLLV